MMKFLYLVSLSAAVFLMAACSSGGSSSGNPPVNPFAYPVAADSNEGMDGNETPATATAATIGATQINTNFPQGDIDVFSVNLTAGTDYEFSANRLCATCDTFMRLFDTDMTSELDSNDDWVSFDSAIQYTPTVSGTYFVEVRALDNVFGVTTYTFGARILVDDDDDGWSTYHDCNDDDSAIKPKAVEVPEDNTDQNCTGFDIPLGTTVDTHEPDNTWETAVTMVEAQGTPGELIYRSELYSASGNLRTIHDASEEDYFKISIPAMSAIQVGVQDDVQGGAFDNAMMAFESDGVTEVSGNNSAEYIENTTNSAVTYYWRFYSFSGTQTGAYVPYYYSIGEDMDGDGFYTRDKNNLRDCNDADAAINPDATETAGDSADSNCDGSDDT